MKQIFFVRKKCDNCGECETACKTEHSQSKNLFLSLQENPKPKPRLKVKFDGEKYIPEFCNHCQDAPCVKACMAAAMQYSSSGAVFNDPDKCVGCWMCIMVCPFGAIEPNDELQVSQKCNGCSGYTIPPCVNTCSRGALLYCEPENF